MKKLSACFVTGFCIVWILYTALGYTTANITIPEYEIIAVVSVAITTLIFIVSFAISFIRHKIKPITGKKVAKLLAVFVGSVTMLFSYPLICDYCLRYKVANYIFSFSMLVYIAFIMFRLIWKYMSQTKAAN